MDHSLHPFFLSLSFSSSPPPPLRFLLGYTGEYLEAYYMDYFQTNRKCNRQQTYKNRTKLLLYIYILLAFCFVFLLVFLCFSSNVLASKTDLRNVSCLIIIYQLSWKKKWQFNIDKIFHECSYIQYF